MSKIEFARDKNGEILERDIGDIEVKCNTSEEVVLEHVKSAIKRHIPQFKPHDEQDKVIAIVGGGPSLKDTFDDLKEKHEAGMKVVSVNGTHDWLMDHGIRPSLHVQLDSRPFNARFVQNWHPDTKYMIASQSHPDVFDALEGADVTMFHLATNGRVRRVLHDYYMGYTVPVGGGNTVMLRTIPMMAMLGFKTMEIFGFDSCCIDEENHIYEQTENDVGTSTTVTVGDREFFCYGWMHSQAQQFITVIEKMGDKFELVVHGDGLIAHILETSATRFEEIQK